MIDHSEGPYKNTWTTEIIHLLGLAYYHHDNNVRLQPVTTLIIYRDTKRMPDSEQKVEFMICLVPELCQLTGLTDDQRNNFRLMKDVATYTRITPNQRHAAFKMVTILLNNFLSMFSFNYMESAKDAFRTIVEASRKTWCNNFFLLNLYFIYWIYSEMFCVGWEVRAIFLLI